MFKSQTARATRLPHVATVVALIFAVAVGIMQSGTHTDAVSASATVR